MTIIAIVSTTMLSSLSLLLLLLLLSCLFAWVLSLLAVAVVVVVVVVEVVVVVVLVLVSLLLLVVVVVVVAVVVSGVSEGPTVGSQNSDSRDFKLRVSNPRTFSNLPGAGAILQIVLLRAGRAHPGDAREATNHLRYLIDRQMKMWTSDVKPETRTPRQAQKVRSYVADSRPLP